VNHIGLKIEDFHVDRNEIADAREDFATHQRATPRTCVIAALGCTVA